MGGQEEIHDVVGIGFGPANIALAAAAAEEAPELRMRFLEARPQVSWQPGMLLRGSDIQNNPIRDLATLRNPRSRFTFVNFLHEQGRLLAFLNVPAHFPLRRDYAQYVRWAGEQLGDVVEYEREVVRVTRAPGPDRHYVVETRSGQSYRGHSLVVGTGRTPYIPELFTPLLGTNIFHSNEYRWRVAELREREEAPRVAVIGASQSAVEITLDLHSGFPRGAILSIMRGFGPRLKDTSPFSEEAFLPEFTDYYFDASAESKRDLDSQLRGTNYSAVDGDVIDALYLRRYEDQIDGTRRLFTYRNREVTAARMVGSQVELSLRERHRGDQEVVVVDAVVLATGFRDLGPAVDQEPHPPVLDGLAGDFATDARGTLQVDRDYFVQPADEASGVGPLFLNGLCESSHGLGDAGSFSLLSLRAETLLTGIKKRLSAVGSPRGR
ncbi:MULTISPECIES: SidA/IucD/PvdA family monooxygenase [unclassified Amycolatopsis]|uniref:SidA/IucD/PvdA family monooxygenase n=1 Tax=unclassified Amycolatopsis TaxID=2618356 RepID=UPI0028743222|nr:MULTISPECIES: SidA/IucD/PvdA family monooxygenase [unclassified Amycolatopsis]MDS0139293.1 SidA/IucD/PvdA family monooxygenase [Amycolatopsis sp. 505]MDS0144525.1 SidA/IucD/PvdA family monooxygenase [Amycolatopsis sp. CM201R]